MGTKTVLIKDAVSIGGKHIPAGTVITVSENMANILISGNRAELCTPKPTVVKEITPPVAEGGEIETTDNPMAGAEKQVLPPPVQSPQDSGKSGKGAK
jgi:hypothetical protein